MLNAQPVALGGQFGQGGDMNAAPHEVPRH